PEHSRAAQAGVFSKPQQRCLFPLVDDLDREQTIHSGQQARDDRERIAEHSSRHAAGDQQYHQQSRAGTTHRNLLSYRACEDHLVLFSGSGIRSRNLSNSSLTVNPPEPARATNSVTSCSNCRLRSASSCGILRSAINVPVPWCVSRKPRISSSRYARSTVFGLMARSTVTCRTVGSWSPGRRTPEAIPPCTWSMSWR